MEIYYRTISEMKMFGWSLTEQESMYPWERDIQQAFIQMEISKRNSNNDNPPPPDFFG